MNDKWGNGSILSLRWRLTTGFATLQYSDSTLESLHVPVLLLRLRLTLAGTRRKPTPLFVHCGNGKKTIINETSYFYEF